MRLRSRLTSATLMLTLAAVGLTACGSQDVSTQAASTRDARATDSRSLTGDATTDAPDDSSETEDQGDSQSADPNDDQNDDQSEGGKRSEQDVIDGYTQLVKNGMGEVKISAATLDKVATCFVDKVYADVSAQTLNAIADGDQMGVDPADTTVFTDASSTCQKKAIG